jgi:hypothetical protein
VSRGDDAAGSYLRDAESSAGCGCGEPTLIGLDAIVGLAFRGLGLCRRDEPGVDEFIPKSGIFIENENAGSEEFILTSLSLLLPSGPQV